MPQPTPPDGPLLFNRVSVSRTSHAIVEQIQELIKSGTLTAGDRLPNERALCEQFGVSRVTVREALRILEANGLVEVRVGSHGGSFLTTPSPEIVGDNLAHLLSLSDISGSAATEARQIYETAMLPLVIERATTEDIAELHSLVAQASESLTAGEYSPEMSAEFHMRLAACTHNSAITALMKSFYGPILTSLSTAKAAAPVMGERGIEEHRVIVDAIDARDLDRATRILQEHLDRTAARIARLEEE